MTRNLCPSCNDAGEHQQGCLKIVAGTGCCANCATAGHDADSCRANLGCDTRTSCINCGKTMSQLPHAFYSLPREVQEVVIALVSAKDVKRKFLTVTHVDDSGKHFSYERGALAAANGVDCLNIDNTRIVLTNGPFESLTLTYSSNDLEAFKQAISGGRKPVPSRKVPSHFPEALADAIEKLTEYGFSYVGDGHTNFKFGNRYAGLTATVSFIP